MTPNSSVEILIPTRNDVRGVARVLSETLIPSMDASVLISVSDPDFQIPILELVDSLRDTRIRVLSSEGNLSLYGNFRRLVENATANAVTICADDDSMSNSTIQECLNAMTDDCSLVIPPIEVRKFDRQNHSFSELVASVPVELSSRYKFIQVSRVAPTWVFGLWRRERLQEIFPPNEFDWLDCALVQNVLLSGDVRFANWAEPITCGIVPERLPWAVNAELGHSIDGWLRYCRSNMPRSTLFEKLSWKLGVERNLRLLPESRHLSGEVLTSLEGCCYASSKVFCRFQS